MTGNVSSTDGVAMEGRILQRTTMSLCLVQKASSAMRYILLSIIVHILKFYQM